MASQETALQKYNPSEVDNKLHPMLDADEEQYDVFLKEVIELHAEPLIRKIIGAKLHVYSNKHPSWYHGNSEADEVDDLCQDAILRLISCLKVLRNDPTDYKIRSLDDFAAKIALNVYNKYLRKKYPQRYSLKRRLYYLLVNRNDFALWKEAYEKIAGLFVWKEIRKSKKRSAELDGIREDSWPFIKSKLAGRPLSQVPLDQLLLGVFEWIEHPLETELLVDTVAGMLKIKDRPKGADNDDKENAKNSPSKEPRELTQVEMREHLTLLWAEIKVLSVRQRWALLSNLRDEKGNGLISALPQCGIASPLEIAAVLEIEPDKLIEFWDRFPLKDAETADRFGISSQQVINLRKAARERLARRRRKILG